jgi:hypothetical protein
VFVRFLRWKSNDASIIVLRKLMPILLLAAFLLPLFAPLLALGQSAESRLPACCRRNGKHHCAMSMAEKGQLSVRDTAPSFTAPAERCPYCPANLMTGQLHGIVAATQSQAFYAGLVSHPAGTPQTKSKRRISENRSGQKRGPPSQVNL